MNPANLRALDRWMEYTKPGHVTIVYRFTANFASDDP